MNNYNGLVQIRTSIIRCLNTYRIYTELLSYFMKPGINFEYFIYLTEILQFLRQYVAYYFTVKLPIALKEYPNIFLIST